MGRRRGDEMKVDSARLRTRRHPLTTPHSTSHARGSDEREIAALRLPTIRWTHSLSLCLSACVSVCVHAWHPDAAHTAGRNAVGEKCRFPPMGHIHCGASRPKRTREEGGRTRVPTLVSLLHTRINDIPRMSHRVTTRTMSIHVQRVSVPLYRALPSAARWCWGQSPKTKKGRSGGGRMRSGSHLRLHPQPLPQAQSRPLLPPLATSPSSASDGSAAALSDHRHTHTHTHSSHRPCLPPCPLRSRRRSLRCPVPPPPRQAAVPHARLSHLPPPSLLSRSPATPTRGRPPSSSGSPCCRASPAPCSWAPASASPWPTSAASSSSSSSSSTSPPHALRAVTFAPMDWYGVQGWAAAGAAAWAEQHCKEPSHDELCRGHFPHAEPRSVSAPHRRPPLPL